MKKTIEVWNELVKEIDELELFETVREYPLNRVMDAAFLKNCEALSLPACLVILDNRDQKIEFKTRTRETSWVALIVAQDAGGEAFSETVDLVDQLADKMLEHTIFEAEVLLLGTHSVDVEPSNPRLSVVSLKFKTRQMEATS